MLHDAMSFSNKTDKEIQHLEKIIDELSWGFELDETFSLKKRITFKLSNAGHILGSCFILFNFPTNNPDNYKVIFSGDLGCTDTPILPDPAQPDACDLLVMESTYGDRNHTNRKDRVNNLEKALQKALLDNGIVYIPAFALGRTQELIYELDRIKTVEKYRDHKKLLNIKAMFFIEEYTLSHSMELADALIGAASIIKKTPL